MKPARTIFNTPVVRQFFFAVSWLGLKMAGWKLKGSKPQSKSFVMIAVPHTSNWDFFITLAMAFVFKINIHWLGKSSLFRAPFGPVMRWFGGISVDRNKSNNVVNTFIERYKSGRPFVLTIAPEGTRSRVKYWKSGFYHIAHGASVPIVLGYLNHTLKEGGLGPSFVTTGDFKADLSQIVAHYRSLIGELAEHLPQLPDVSNPS